MSATPQHPMIPPLTPEPDATRQHKVLARMSTRSRAAYVVIFAVTVGLTPLLLIAEASFGFAQTLATIGALFALAVVPWRPIFGLYLMVACAVVIEQEPLLAGPIGTDRLYIFTWPAKLQGNIERPIGYFCLVILAVIILARLLRRQRPLIGGRLFYPFVLFVAALLVGVLHGLASGGTFRIIVLELRPWWYFFLAYLLAHNIVSSVKHVRNILWITVLGTAFKGAQGVYIVYRYLGGQIGGHNEIMAHEQSFFFILVILLLVLMLLHQVQPWFMVVIIVSLPCLLIALVANNRRADYVALLIGIGVAWVLTILVKPESRRTLIPALLICMVLGAGYVLAFQKTAGSLGEPARAVISVFNPNAASARDAASNLYRSIENYDLKYTEAQSPILGYGFGKPFLQPVMLANVLELDPYYLYIPHNNVLWIWMRLGPLGYGALWYLIGAALIAGCLIARRLQDQQLRFFAIFAVAALVMEVVLAYGDYQFFFYRNMIFIGVLLGVLMKLPAIERASLGQPELYGDGLGDISVASLLGAQRRTRLGARLPLPAAALTVAAAAESEEKASS